MDGSWLEIACDVPADITDVVAEYLSELSGSGVCTENLTVDTFSTGEISHAPVMTVRAYFSDSVCIETLTAEISLFLNKLADQQPVFKFAKPVVSKVRSEDWSNSWKVNFKALRVGRRLLIVPSWEEARPCPDDIVLHLDPGMAFGTGGHETTRLCLELLERIMDEMPALVSPSILDLGTGSGILAMAAVQLGAGRVCAVDIDPQAVEVAQNNLAANGLSGQVEFSTTPLESMTASFDIILANILAEELVRLAPHLTERLTSGGLLVLSGILAEKESMVRKGFAPYPLNYQETLHEGEWVAILYRKRIRP